MPSLPATVYSVVRDRVPETTAVLTLVSLALVFGAALRVVPASALPEPSAAAVAAIPHVNAAISAAALAAVMLGVRAIRRNRVDRHRKLMGTAFALFVAFLALYLYKVALEGPASFPGPDAVYQFVYLPLLAIHVLLAVAALPLLYYVLLLALTRPVSELPRTAHPRVGRVAAPLWAASFVLGIVVYLLLYWVY